MTASVLSTCFESVDEGKMQHQNMLQQGKRKQARRIFGHLLASCSSLLYNDMNCPKTWYKKRYDNGLWTVELRHSQISIEAVG